MPMTGINVNVAFAKRNVGLVRFIRVIFPFVLLPPARPRRNEGALVNEGDVFEDLLPGSNFDEIFLTTKTNISKLITNMTIIGISFQ